FQAEDGIRDGHVTGVQTCALPISSEGRLPRLVGLGNALKLTLTGNRVDAAEALRVGLVDEVVPHSRLEQRTFEIADRIASRSAQIGRASCRERVWSAGGA